MGGVDLSTQYLVAGGKTQRLDTFVGELASQAQRTLDGDLPVPKVLRVEPFGVGGILCLAEIEFENAGNVGLTQFAILPTEVAT
ncbi:hypothetical protein ALQ92_03146 [Pseudomonas syringae pv. pisi]|nr:hypothetical protein ALQ92_03146 [Pseudomonas syringae pv. pisi]